MIRFSRYFFVGLLAVLFTAALSGSSFAKVKSSSTFEYTGPSISFEQFFQNPDDNELRLNYARQQAAEGDFISAAHALEGMLYASPNWDTARLFYAILLAELDDRVGATYEFNILVDRPLSAEHMSITKTYLKKLEAK